MNWDWRIASTIAPVKRLFSYESMVLWNMLRQKFSFLVANWILKYYLFLGLFTALQELVVLKTSFQRWLRWSEFDCGQRKFSEVTLLFRNMFSPFFPPKRTSMCFVNKLLKLDLKCCKINLLIDTFYEALDIRPFLLMVRCEDLCLIVQTVLGAS